MNLINSKSLLAKLMATENLIVEQRNVPTAAFDVQNRLLVVPILNEKIDGYTYDLFMGHEVGHALYTPLEGMVKAKELGIDRSILNVVEDNRIERKIRTKYPGLRNSFSRAYTSLFDKDFFGTKGKDTQLFNLVDKINLYSKIGAYSGVIFDGIEQEIYNEVNATQTYDDVIRVSQKIVEYMQQELEKQKEILKELEGDEDFEASFEIEGEPMPSDDVSYADDIDDSQNDSTSISEPSKGFEDEKLNLRDYIKSYTDEAYRENEKQLFQNTGKSIGYANVPVFDKKTGIMDFKETLQGLDEFYVNRYDADYLPVFNQQLQENFNKLKESANKPVSYLVKEFELRKNADQLKRASVAKTGELNMNRVYSYTFSEDIFKKISVVPNGKSHGLVMFIDWSGSMSEHIENTVKQLFSLVLFCRKVNIPFDVYAFVEQSTERYHKQQPKINDLVLQPFLMVNLLSNRMNANEFKKATSYLYYMAISRYATPKFLHMSGTPLNEAVIAALEIIPEFQKRNKLQVVNTVFLTDGEGHRNRNYFAEVEKEGTFTMAERTFSNGFYGNFNRMVLTDTKTKHQATIKDLDRCSDYTSALIELLKARTGCNVLGFYVLKVKEFQRAYNMIYKYDYSQFESLKSKFRKEKSLVVQNGIFDEYYLLKSDKLDTEEDTEFVVKENVTTRGLVSAFSKYTNTRIQNRVILNRFIGLIS